MNYFTYLSLIKKKERFNTKSKNKKLKNTEEH